MGYSHNDFYYRSATDSVSQGSWVWWYLPVIPALGRRRQENFEFKASLCYIARPCLKKKKKVRKVTV
jgi:hypothetical protein